MVVPRLNAERYGQSVYFDLPATWRGVLVDITSGVIRRSVQSLKRKSSFARGVGHARCHELLGRTASGTLPAPWAEFCNAAKAQMCFSVCGAMPVRSLKGQALRALTRP